MATGDLQGDPLGGDRQDRGGDWAALVWTCPVDGGVGGSAEVAFAREEDDAN